MRVKLIGQTLFLAGAFQEATGFLAEGSGGQDLAEAAGRLCYLSWHRPNPATATNRGYLSNILDQRHYSVLEHNSYAFLIQGISRSCSHQIARHRHLSISELSQRFVDVGNATMVTHPAMADEDPNVLTGVMFGAWKAYEKIVDLLTAKGLKRKQAREAARSVMPEMTETKLVLSGNVRAWRHFLAKRGTVHADAEIRNLAVKIAEILKEAEPNMFQDMAIVPFSDGVTVIMFDNEETS